MKKTRIILLLGQSNMVGSGDGIPQNIPNNSRVKMLTLDDKILIASNPMFVNSSSPPSTPKYPELYQQNSNGPGLSFSRELLNNIQTNEDILLIPNARGASCIDEFVLPYQINQFFKTEYENSLLDVAIKRIKEALRLVPNSYYGGTLYYQGECNAQKYFELYSQKNQVFEIDNSWGHKLIFIKNTLNKEFGNAPFIFSQLCTYNITRPFLQDAWQNFKKMQQTVSIKYSIPMIKTDDLNVYDGLHLTSSSQIEVGKRFAEEYILEANGIFPILQPPSWLSLDFKQIFKESNGDLYKFMFRKIKRKTTSQFIDSLKSSFSFKALVVTNNITNNNVYNLDQNNYLYIYDSNRIKYYLCDSGYGYFGMFSQDDMINFVKERLVKVYFYKYSDNSYIISLTNNLNSSSLNFDILSFETKRLSFGTNNYLSIKKINNINSIQDTDKWVFEILTI